MNMPNTPRDMRDAAMASDATPPIPHALSLLDSHFRGLESDLERLEHKIGPTLNPEIRGNVHELADDGKTRPVSELVSVLSDMSDRFSNLRHRLDTIIDRVEL